MRNCFGNTILRRRSLLCKPKNYGKAAVWDMKYTDGARPNEHDRLRSERELDEYDNYSDDIPFDEPFSVVSATDFTGLMPFVPDDWENVESYRDMYDVPLPKIRLDENGYSD